MLKKLKHPLVLLCSMLLLVPNISMAEEDKDITREQLAWALINYDAEARIKEYNQNRALLFMQAPGTTWALQAAQVAGQGALRETAINYANRGYLSSLQLLTRAKGITLGNEEISFKSLPTTSAGTFFDQMSAFFLKGDASAFNQINPANILQRDNVKDSNLTNEQLIQMIALIADPLPTIDPTVEAKLQSGRLNGDAKESLARYLAQSIAAGVSANAIGDMIARRTQTGNQPQSTMDMMSEYSKERFINPDWYTSLAASSEPAVLREIAQMMAFSIWLQNQQFRVAEQQMTLMATFNANMSRLTNTIEALNAAVGNLSNVTDDASKDISNKLDG